MKLLSPAARLLWRRMGPGPGLPRPSRALEPGVVQRTAAPGSRERTLRADFARVGCAAQAPLNAPRGRRLGAGDRVGKDMSVTLTQKELYDRVLGKGQLTRWPRSTACRTSASAKPAAATTFRFRRAPRNATGQRAALPNSKALPTWRCVRPLFLASMTPLVIQAGLGLASASIGAAGI